MSSKDLLSFHPTEIKLIRDEELIKIMDNPKYRALLTALREKPLTMTELTRRYNLFALQSKERMTIYNYLNFLIKKGFVVKAGQRVEQGKTATEYLYSRTAKLFVPVVMSEEFWKSEESSFIIGKLAKFLELYLKTEEISIEDLTKLVFRVFSETQAEMGDFFERRGAIIPELFGDSSNYELNQLLEILTMITLMLKPPIFKKELKKIFPDLVE
ncbi:MAG: hypothetical protein ACTSSG_13045 [Candidatus Heimdallarchaeaceae archaeon]